MKRSGVAVDFFYQLKEFLECSSRLWWLGLHLFLSIAHQIT